MVKNFFLLKNFKNIFYKKTDKKKILKILKVVLNENSEIIKSLGKTYKNSYKKKQLDKSKYVPEGVEGLVKFKGNVDKVIFKLVGGLKSSMGYLGAKTILKLRKKPNFVKITKAGFYESMVHNIDEVKKDSEF